MTEKLLNRFLKYVKINTQADSHSTTYPSSSVQIDFAKQLVEDCKAIGLQDAQMDEYGYVFATLPSNIDEKVPTIGFISHMDTVPDYPGANVKPQIVENYDGKDIVLNADLQVVLSPEKFPVLHTLQGETLITTDGTTVLGSDDKAGIAEILTAMEYLIAHPEIPHGTIRVGFTPDEEIGHGVDHFDVARFNADFAYTIDGSSLGEIQCESFNAAGATIVIKGLSVHPGFAKGKMKNALTIACEFQNMLPCEEVPERTEGYEGFYHLHAFEGHLEEVTLSYIVRDHDRALFNKRKANILNIAKTLNEKYGEDTVTVEMADNYYNMREVIDQHPEIMALAERAFAKENIVPKCEPIRGGTDGSRLSFMGLPCPNIFTGGYNCHGKYEFAVLSHMEAAVRAILAICELGAQK